MALTRRSVVRGLALSSGFLIDPPRSSLAQSRSEFTQIRQGADQLMTILNNQPYVVEGAGAPLYIVMSHTCGFCEALRLEQPKAIPGVEFRWLPGPYSGGSRDQLVEVLLRRDVPTFNAYMRRQLAAQPLTSRTGGVDAYNRSVVFLTEYVKITMANGGTRGTPSMVWVKQNNVFYSMGYTKELFGQVIRHIKA